MKIVPLTGRRSSVLSFFVRIFFSNFFMVLFLVRRWLYTVMAVADCLYVHLYSYPRAAMPRKKADKGEEKKRNAGRFGASIKYSGGTRVG